MRSLAWVALLVPVVAAADAPPARLLPLHEFTWPAPDLVTEVSAACSHWGALGKIIPNIYGAPDVQRRQAYRVVEASLASHYANTIDVRGFKLGTGACAKTLGDTRGARGDARAKIFRCLGEFGPELWGDSLVAYSEDQLSGTVFVDLTRGTPAIDAYLEVTARKTTGSRGPDSWYVTALTVRTDRAKVEAMVPKLTPLGTPPR